MYFYKADKPCVALKLQHDTCPADTRHASMSSGGRKTLKKEAVGEKKRMTKE